MARVVPRRKSALFSLTFSGNKKNKVGSIAKNKATKKLYQTQKQGLIVILVQYIIYILYDIKFKGIKKDQHVTYIYIYIHIYINIYIIYIHIIYIYIYIYIYIICNINIYIYIYIYKM